MSECPKCGSDQILGPRYTPGQGCACHPEGLLYTCARCGYVARKIKCGKKRAVRKGGG